MTRRTARLTALAFAFAAAPASFSQSAFVDRPYELTFTSDHAYPHPIADVRLDAVFTGPDGRRDTVAGFWDGGATYRVRFAPSLPGRWTFSTWSSDDSNAGLHDRTGAFDALPYTGPDVFARKGWPVVSENGRFLTYGDGDPFFLLGDTAWEIVWKSDLASVRAHIADRRRKGFNALYVVPMSHQALDTFGVRNRAGEPFFLDHDYSKPNPRYFDYLDVIVQTANDSGFVVALVPLWGQMTEVHHVPKHQRYTISRTHAFGLARYVGARYAGHNVIWFAGGDNQYDTNRRQSFWTDFARVLGDASGGRHLMTVHPGGCRSSFDYFAPEADWIDFRTFQSSHILDGPCTTSRALRGYRLTPPKPVLNGEGNYEDLFSKFWLSDVDTVYPGAVRLNARAVRQAAYESLLAGALAGFSYGANGIWQWSTPENMGAYRPRYTHDRARDLPGSSHVGLMRRLLEHFDWYTLAPYPTGSIGFDGLRAPVLARSAKRIVAYVQAETRSLGIAVPLGWTHPDVLWIDPTDGSFFRAGRRRGDGAWLTLVPPDASDWLLIVGPELAPPPFGTERPYAPPPSADVPSDPILHTDAPWPSPMRGSGRLTGRLNGTGDLELRVWDALGREVYADRLVASPGWFALPLPALPPGLHPYRITFRTDEGTLHVDEGTLISIGPR